MATQEMVRDEFSSEEFEGTSTALPYLQMSNNQDPKKCGVFLSLENAEECGFTPDKTWRQFTLTFASGETSEGYLTSSPRFAVVRRGELLMYDRENDRDIIGKFNRDTYDNSIHVIKNKFMVFVVGADNKPLHDNPLQFTAKGAFSGDFGSNYTKFRTALSNAYGKSIGTTKARGDKFLALGVMAFHIEPVLKGDKKKSWTSGIGNLELPTAENWKNYFVGYDEPTKLLIYSAFDGSEAFGTLASLRREEEPSDDGYGLPPVPTKPTMSVADYLKSVAMDAGIPWDDAAAALKDSGKFKGVRPSEFTPEQIEAATGIIHGIVALPDDDFEQAAFDEIPF
jgi:hypothetical protein